MRFAKHGGTRVEALDEAVADSEGQQVETQLGQALLDALKGVRLEAGEQGDEEVLSGVSRLGKGVGLLHGEERPGTEIAKDFGVFPPVELGGEGEIFREFLLVLPFDVAAVFGNGSAEEIGFLVAVVVDVTAAKIPAEIGRGAGVAAVAGGRAEHDAAGRINAEVAPEP